MPRDVKNDARRTTRHAIEVDIRHHGERATVARNDQFARRDQAVAICR
jgi:hypothetical protein